MKLVGGAIERWEDPEFRKCFGDILSGNWRFHDPYDLDSRLNARSSLYGRPGQVSIFLSEETSTFKSFAFIVQHFQDVPRLDGDEV
jgi:Protein of unknown function (DUF1479)